ncbi:hypothetical protein EYM_00610 [Ignicoccus islandicus DSM 13165]|uniref:ABC3 transporter permease C-terminal domain-containing protein n=1 Tax=Ignicoccus islandicus DSM 13165 TaxID=940295 RepID=A0A0U2MAB7_9CREN|nr:FtsX-like permease family protein [Ignicoccus islandicus]ALU12125.1 hypothetical protein EYM_00610 [Ignicoccus islandicus DSM 13165]
MRIFQVVLWDLFKRPLRNLLIVVMLSIATVSLMVTLTISQAAFQMLQSYLNVFSPNVVIVAGPVLPVSLSFASSLPGVKAIYPLVISDGYLQCNNSFSYVMLIGYSNISAIAESTSIKLIKGKFGVDVSEGLSKFYGKKCELVTSFFGSYNLTIEGVVELRNLEEVMQRSNIVLAPMEVLEGAIPNALVIVAKSPKYVNIIEDEIVNATAGQAFIFSQRSLRKVGETVTSLASVTSTFLGFLSISIASIAIAVIAIIDVKDRRWEIGLLKALGFESKDLAFLYSLESLIYSTISLTIGIALSGAILNLAKHSFGELLRGLINSEIIVKSLTINESQVIRAILIVIGVNLISSTIPALISYSTDPVRALRQIE